MPTTNSAADKATLYQLSQPEKLSSVLAQDKVDCLSCRLTDPAGGAAFIGLGAYTYLSSTRQLEAQRDKILKSGSRFGLKSRRFGVLGLSATLVGMGLYRFVN
ncbi:MAG: hypothetical protein LQ339_003127 [Xanthoria mediterranea]|nr:MAG: hypothetical protein LQ339_003127 [Xanthoria mediterranea]